MEVKAIQDKVVLKLGFKEAGLEGRDKFTSKSFNNIRAQAEDLAVYETAKILADLQTKDLNQIAKIETTILEEV